MANGDKPDKEDLRIVREQLDALKEAFGIRSRTTSEQQAQLNLSKQLAKFAQDQLVQRDKTLLTERSIKDISKDLTKAKELEAKLEKEVGKEGSKVNKNLKEQRDLASKIVKDLSAQEKKATELEDSMGGLALIMKSIEKTPFVGQLIEADKALEAMRDALDKGTSVMKAGFGSVINSVGKLVGPALFGLMLDSLFEANKSVTQLQKNLGISALQATKFRLELSAAALSANDLRVTTEGMLQTNQALNSEYQSAAIFNAQTLASTTSLLDAQILSAEAVGQLAGDAARLGISIDQAAQSQEDAVNAVNAQTGAQISLRTVLEASNRISGQIRAQLGANPEAIARAVTQAKALGFELDQIAASGRALLDFESSIANELEAELLTGKQLNLERARLAALTGDLETLTAEIAANVGDFNDFTSLNVLQQEAIAKSVGMTADALANSLITEENRAQLLADAVATGNEQSIQQLKALDATEKFAKALEQVKALFVDVFTILSPIVDLIGMVANIAATLPGKFALIGATIGRYVLPKLIAMVVAQTTLTPFKTIAGLAAAGAVVGGIMSYAKGDDVGYGNNMLVTKNKGAIMLNNNDSVVAGTNLLGGGGTEIDYDRMAAAMSKAQVNVSTRYDSFKANSTSANGGRYQSAARYESKFA